MSWKGLREEHTYLVIFSETFQAEAYGEHAGVCNEGDGIVGITDMWGGFFGERREHVGAEVVGGEDVAFVYRHDDGLYDREKTGCVWLG